MSQAQIVLDGCVSIDFESIEGVPAVAGMSINNQYFDAYGISFMNEDGTAPVLAGFGEPMEAFIANGVADFLIDGSSFGQFMLTDDGILDTPTYSPLIITFETPIYGMSSYILDLDGDEYFEVTAFDMGGNVILEERIESGDPMTGDGIATLFEISPNACDIARIYSIRINGVRPGGGSFGLGMDNFVFCFEGIYFLEDLDVKVTDILCQGNPGQIEIINNGNTSLMYSIDGNNFNTTGIFPDLGLGDYLITVRDENGCEIVFNEMVVAIGPTIIEELVVVHTSCGENNGSFEVTATQDQGVIYYIDAFNPTNLNTFENLVPGEYLITIIGPTGCSASQEIVINPSEVLSLDAVTGIDDACGKSIGSISVNSTGGTGLLSYSIDDGMNFQNESVFDSLTQGFYQVVLQDEALCTFEDTISLYSTPGVLISEIQTTETLCEIPAGSIQFSAEGGTGDLQFQINGGALQDESIFFELNAGEYEIIIEDEIGCTWDAFAEIESPVCPIYIPNVFTPEGPDGFNNQFQILTPGGQDVEILSYEIYDRWGSRIYSAYNFNINSTELWWEGRGDGVKWASGVYVYKIEVEFYNDTRMVYAGDITLVR